MTPEAFIAKCAELGVSIERAHGGLITLTKRFTPGDTAAFAAAETDVSILYDVPTAGDGSTWGTDGGSMGGMVAIKDGRMRLNRSNVSKRFVAKVAKLISLVPAG